MPTAAGRRKARPTSRARAPVRWRKSDLPPAVMKEVIKQLPKGATNVRVMRRGRRGKKFRVLFEVGGKRFQVFPWNVTKANFKLYPKGQVGAPMPQGVIISPAISPTISPTNTFNPTINVNPHIVAEGRGGRERREVERPPPGEPHRLDPNQLDDIRRELETAMEARKKAVNQLLGGAEKHQEFANGSKSTRGGIFSGLRGLLSPKTWWTKGPTGSMATLYDSIRYSRHAKAGHKLRAAPYGTKIYITGRGEKRRAGRLERVKEQVNPESVRTALAQCDGAVNQAFAELMNNPTPAQEQLCKKQIADAVLVFDKAQIEVEAEFRRRMRKKGMTTGGKDASQVRRLGRM